MSAAKRTPRAITPAEAAYSRLKSERYQLAERQQAPNGEWFLAPRAFKRLVAIGDTTLRRWLRSGVPILEWKELDAQEFRDGSGRITPYYSERQVKEIVKAHKKHSGVSGQPGIPLGRGAYKLSVLQRAEWIQDEKGNWWLSPKAAARYTGHLNGTLAKWADKDGPGCPPLGGQRLRRRQFSRRFNGPAYYYALEQLDAILAAEAANNPAAEKPDYIDLSEAERRYGIPHRKLVHLIEKGRVRGDKGLGLDRNGKSCRPRRLACVEDLERYQKGLLPSHDQGGESDEKWMTVAMAADRLGVKPEVVRSMIARKELDGQPSHGRYGNKPVWHSLILVPRSQVENLHQQRQQPCVLRREYRDDNGNLWLPVILARERYGFRLQELRNHAFLCESSWLLDGRQNIQEKVPQMGARRSLRYQRIEKKGRGWPFTFIYLDADLRIMRARRDGELSAEEARCQARVVLQRLLSGTNGRADKASASGPEPRATLTPRWDDQTATLYWGETPIREFRSNPAKNQRDLVEAFHKAKWERTVSDPFRDARKLNVTIYQLNKSLKPKLIRFRGDGTGEGAIWEPINS